MKYYDMRIGVRQVSCNNHAPLLEFDGVLTATVMIENEGIHVD
jgi:hypothetical protein